MQAIQDYLQTQALNLSPEEVAISRASTQAVIHHGCAYVDPMLWQHSALPEQLAAESVALKALFMALDSVYTHHPLQSATLYVWQPENQQAQAKTGTLIRVAHIGQTSENYLPVNEHTIDQHLAARTAQSGWANLVENMHDWLLPEHHQNIRAISQISLPVCGENGIVYGVLHLQHSQMLPENQLAAWLGLALGVLPTMQALACHEADDDIQAA